ncbi:MAG: efflux RND transporter periplasmic adaptor subunit [Rhizobiales bacterium]|nr:efflux RND transporter periplasmic adaptor subunit [Hyphomicrobiales bacterium]
MRRAAIGRLVLALGLGSAVGACQDRAVEPAKPAAQVKVEAVAFTDYSPAVSLTGEIRARFQADLSFRVSGRITERNVDVGAHVTADQILARLDPQEQQADVDAAQASVRAAEAQVRQAASAFERQKTLLGQGFTTRRDHDQAEAALRTAQGSLDAARAQLATAQEALSYTGLRAGAAGIITARNAEVGQVAQAAQAMFTLAQDGPRDAVFQVHESAFLQQPENALIGLALVSDPSVRTTGKVREISPTVDARTGTVRVTITVNDTPDAMTLGTAISGTARLKSRHVVILPWSALASDSGRPAVYVVDAASKVAGLRQVTVLAYQTGKVVISAGLRPGDLVVTDGTKLLRPDEVVAMIQSGPSGATR